ncbi:MAG: hypothetical protein ABI652_07490 [Acidobacteriota bacterium]
MFSASFFKPRRHARQALALVVLFSLSNPQWVRAEPIISVWYRGTPRGIPLQEDLEEIRALGFAAVTWPLDEAAHLLDVRRMANAAGLTVIVRASIASLTAATALIPSDRVDLETGALKIDEMAPIAWRAIAHGARVISFDAGQATGAGLETQRRAADWTKAALLLGRQFSGKGTLFDDVQPGPRLTVAGADRLAFDAALLATPKSWVVIVTNTDAKSIKATIQFPPAVPPAMWVSLIDGSTMSLLAQASGPKWTLTVPGHGVLAYVIDKAGAE